MRVEARPASSRGFMPGCQSTTPWPSMSSPRRPARPVSWVYSPGVMSAWVSPFHFDSFSITTVRAGMLMPSASVSVAKTTLQSPRTKSSSTHLLEGRQHPGVVGGDAAGEPVEEVVVAEDVAVLVGQVRDSWPRRTRRSCRAPPGVVSRTLAVEALGDRGVAADPAEDEHDRRQQPLAVEPLDHVRPARDPDPAAVADLARVLRRAWPALARRPPVAHQPGARPVVARDPHQLVVDRRALLDEAGGGVDVGGRRTGRAAAGRP